MSVAGRPEWVGCECVSCEFLPTARFRFLDDHCNPMRIGFDFNILSEFLHLPRCTPSKPTVVAYPPLVYPLRQVRLLTGRWHIRCCSGALGTRAPSVDWLNSSTCVYAGGKPLPQSAAQEFRISLIFGGACASPWAGL